MASHKVTPGVYFMVPKRGLEPPQSYDYTALNRARLPISPLRPRTTGYAQIRGKPLSELLQIVILFPFTNYLQRFFFKNTRPKLFLWRKQKLSVKYCSKQKPPNTLNYDQFYLSLPSLQSTIFTEIFQPFKNVITRSFGICLQFAVHLKHYESKSLEHQTTKLIDIFFKILRACTKPQAKLTAIYFWTLLITFFLREDFEYEPPRSS